MQSLNVLLLGKSSLYERIHKSKYLKKLYVTFEQEGLDAVFLQVKNKEDLIRKCKALQIDIVLVEDETLVFSGVADELKKKHVNCISLNHKWMNLVSDFRFSKSLLSKYGISTPQSLSFPQNYPLVLRIGRTCRIVQSLEEMIRIKEIEIPEEFVKDVFLEEFLDGEKFNLTMVFDGQNLLFFPNGVSNSMPDFVLLKEKLQEMFNKENVDFTGFLNAKLIYAKNQWYILGFNTKLNVQNFEGDILFLLNAVIYQKLNELQ